MKLPTKVFLGVVSTSVLTALATAALLIAQIRPLVEEAMGDQMVVQARITAHLVAIAEERGMSSQEINAHLRQIAGSVKGRDGSPIKYEFWITRGGRRAYLKSEDDEFEFGEKQSKAFLALLNDSHENGDGEHVDVVSQESRPRDLDSKLFKYVGVSGADDSRIVQVGYAAEPLMNQLSARSYRLAGLMAGIYLLAGGAGFLLLRRMITDPVTSLTNAARALKGGTFSEITLARSVRRNDELGDLAKVFKELAADVIERKRSYDELIKEAAGNKQSIVLRTNSNGIITDCNQHALEVFGYSKDEFLGQHMKIIIPPGETLQEVEDVLGSIKEGDPSDNLNANVTRDGRRLWVAWKNRVHRHFEDGSREILSIGDDITGLMRKDETLAQRAGQILKMSQEVAALQVYAEEARGNMRAFLSKTAHELRRPLHSILGYTEELLDSQLTTHQKHDLEIVESQARLLKTTIESLLDIARIEAGKLELEHKPFSLREIVEHVVSGLAPAAHEKSVPLLYRIDPGLPDRVIGDPDRLGQIIANLVNNSIKFSTKGRVLIEFTTPHPPTNVTCTLVGRVSDSGTGIPEGKWAAVFEPYEQIPASSDRKYGGLGLGLAISRGLIELMRGSIEVERSSPGLGSTFRFEIELELDPDQTRGAPPVDCSGRTGLLVASDEFARAALAETLERWGMRIVGVADEVEARARLDDGVKPDVALVYVNIGSGGEFDLDGSLRVCNFTGALPVVLFVPVGRVQEEARRRTAKLAAADVVHQPPTRSELAGAVARLLQIPRASIRLEPTYVACDRGDGLRILVVDDEEVDRLLAARRLKRLGHQVTLAANGEEALRAIASQEFDIALMDIDMPHMDGFQVTAEIREREKGSGRRLPVIAVSAAATHQDRDRWLRMGMDECVAKPVERAVLAAMIDTISTKRSHPRKVALAVSTPACGMTIIDLIKLRYETEDDADDIRMVAGNVVRNSPGWLSSLRDALNQRDFPTLCRIAHKLKGEVGAVWAPLASEATSRLYHACRMVPSDDTDPDKLEAIATALEEVELRLSELEPHLRMLMEEGS